MQSLPTEPPPDDHPLLTLPNCIITPHIAWAPGEARTRLLHIAIENLRAFLAGNPVNVVS
jgi:glycerate dehydrogenase